MQSKIIQKRKIFIQKEKNRQKKKKNEIWGQKHSLRISTMLRDLPIV